MLTTNDIIPANEEQRLAAVRRYGILDTPPDAAFDRITKLAAHFFNAPIAMISIVDSDRIWFKSYYGLDFEQVDRDPGFCASAILQNDVYIVTDAKVDPHTLVHSLVVGNLGLRFYAAAPLQTNDGFNLGTICVLDLNPREVTEIEKQTLKDLAAIVIDQLDLRLTAKTTVALEVGKRMQVMQEQEQTELAAYIDILTGLKNQRAFELNLELQALQAIQHGSDAMVVLIDLDGLKSLNDTLGYKQGDVLLKAFAIALQSVFREEDTVYRFGGDEFALILPLKNRENFDSLKRNIEKRLESAILQTQQVVMARMSASAGVAMLSEVNGLRHEVVRLADARMYVEKLKNRYTAHR